MSLRSVLLTPAPTSSKKTILASTIIVLANSKSFFWPPDRFPALSFFRCSIFKGSAEEVKSNEQVIESYLGKGLKK